MNLDLHPDLSRLRAVSVGRAIAARRRLYSMLSDSIVSYTQKSGINPVEMGGYR